MAQDQARLIVAILENPGPHQGKIYPLYGPVETDHESIAAAVSEVIGRPVAYQPLEIEAYRKILEQRPDLSPHFVQHICAVGQDYRDGVFAGRDGVIGQITGQAPMTVQAFITTHKDAFNA